MAYPTKYARQYDYQSYQNANPTRPLPGDKVNVDLNYIVGAIDEIVEFQKLLQNSDGSLANNSVTLDQLDPTIAASFGDLSSLADVQALVDQADADVASTAADAAQTTADRAAAASSATDAAASATDAAASATASASSASDAAASAAAAAFNASGVVVQPQGRLTLTTGVAVTSSDVTGASTLYYALAGGRTVPIYNGTQFVSTVFAELSLALDATAAHTNYHQSGKNYDVFVIDDGGTVRLGTGPKWDAGAVAGSDTARGTGTGSTELEWFEGVPTNKNQITIRYGSASGDTVTVLANRATYLGTIRTTADGQTEDSAAKRFVYNEFNQAIRRLFKQDTTVSWTYSTTSFRQANGSTANQVAVVRGGNAAMVHVETISICSNSTATNRTIATGIGVNSTTTNSARAGAVSVSNVVNGTAVAVYDGVPGLGYATLAWLEKGGGTDTQTWFGSSGLLASGLSGWTLQ